MTHAPTYARRAQALSAAAVVMCAGAAQACAIQQQSCEIPGGGLAFLDGHNGSVVLFTEVGADFRTAVVTECNSRQSLAISERDAPDVNTFWDAERIMSEAVYDDAEQTLSALSRQIRQQTGVATERFTLAANHCGCDLPNMPRPPSNCPTDF